MSDKAVKTGQEKSVSKILKWFFAILLIAVLEVGAIFSAVYISESRNKTINSSERQFVTQITEQKMRLDALDKLPIVVSNNAQQLTASTRTIELLSENLNTLVDDIKNYKLDTLDQKFADINHKIESIDERSNTESLVLSVALMIKENALYHRSFVLEADILNKLAQDDIKNQVEIISNYKQKNVLDYKELADQYHSFAKNLIFSKAEEVSEHQEETAVSKGVKILKDTVSNINFDKVIVLKKEKNSDEEKKLLENLENLVDSYNYAEALNYIKNNADFQKIDNQKFVTWQESVHQTLEFETALAQIINSQLSALKQDIKQDKIVTPNALQSPEDEISSLPVEDASNDEKVD